MIVVPLCSPARRMVGEPGLVTGRAYVVPAKVCLGMVVWTGRDGLRLVGHGDRSFSSRQF